MRKLFALEEADLELEGVKATAGDAEELEAVELESEVEEEAGDLESDIIMIDEAENALDQGGEIAGVVEASLNQEEGLEPIAAEAIRIAMEAVCARVGANPKSIYSLYATENFESPSSRRANTRIALEGIKGFLSDLWEKIKKAVKNMKEKFRAFWDKHISSLGQMKKTLEAMKKKVNSSKGTLKNSMMDKGPGKIVNKFPTTGSMIDDATISEYVEAHNKLVDESKKGMTETADAGEQAASTVEVVTSSAPATAPATEEDSNAAESTSTLLTNFYAKLKLKDEDDVIDGLVGGKKVIISTTLDKENQTLEFDVRTEDMDNMNKDVPLHLAEKSALSQLLGSTITMIDNTIKAKASMDKADNSSSRLEKELNDTIAKFSKAGGSAEAIKALRGLTKVYNKLNKRVVKQGYKFLSMNTTCAAGVVSYAKLSLSKYTEDKK